ncbi:heat shock cognate 70 kDa protein, partial [Tanacetum coccineum]
KYKGEDKQYAPEELSAMVLKKMKEAAEEYIGGKVTDAVITVPAYFSNQQREATKEAGTIAGLNVLRLLNEPTAAAIAYGDINVKAVGGDTHLGGEDFDTTLVNYCVRVFMKKHREVNLKGNPRAMARLKVACEKAKRDLSSTTFASIEIDCLYEGNDFSIKISRAKFEELNSTYFTKCVQLVEKCLFDGEMKKKDVDEVVVVGGSSRIPKVQRMVEEYFEGKTLYKTMNGDEAVASGAAIMAARLSGNDDNMKNDVVLQDVTPLSLGTAVQINGVRDNMSVVVPRNTSIPTSKKKMFRIPPNETNYLACSTLMSFHVPIGSQD